VTERLVVVGGDAAGMSAASQARRRRGADDLSIVAFEQGRTTSYSACGIPYWISGTVEHRGELITRTPEQFRKRQDIDMRTQSRVTGVDLGARTVRVQPLDDESAPAADTYDEPFDQLVIATGSVPTRPPVPGIDAAGVYGVQTLDDGEELRRELASSVVGTSAWRLPKRPLSEGSRSPWSTCPRRPS